MSTAIEINGTKLIPLKEAVGSVAYSRDYVSRLAREGKITASQIGRQWFVDLESLKNYSAAAEVEEAKRKHELSVARKGELLVKDRFAALERQVAMRRREHSRDALMVTASALCLGLIVGASVYTLSIFSGVALPTAPTFAVLETLVGERAPVQKQVARALPVVPEPRETMILTTVMEQPVFVAEQDVRELTSETGGVLLLTEGASAGDEAAVEALFSDEVEVTFTGDSSGVVRFERSPEEVVELPFVSVPSETFAARGDEEVTTKTP